MIGTGASGMQVGPSIAPQVDQLNIFQRTPHWALYNPIYHEAVSDGVRWALKNMPYYANWYRFQLFWASADGLYPSLHVDKNWPQSSISLNATNHKLRQDLISHITKELHGDSALLEK